MHALWLNLQAGARLAFGLPISAGQLRISIEQFWLLVVLGAGCSLASDWILTSPPRAWSAFGLWEEALFLVTVCLGAFMVARMSGAPNLQMQLPICVLASAPYIVTVATLVTLLADQHLAESPAAGTIGYAVLGWWWVVLFRAQKLGSRNHWSRRGIQAMFMLAVLVVPELYWPQGGYWYTRWPEENSPAESTAGPALNAEQVFFDQPGLLAERLRGLLPEQMHQPDLYMIGFAAYGEQDVFRNEVLFLEQLANTTLGNGLRYMPLINHRDTVQRVPLASLTNLEASAESIGRMMNAEEDVLMVYLTSHGSEEHELAVELGQLPFSAITPETLSAALDHARVRWKVIIVSSCFSGGFVSALASAHTLVITAARADRNSFGCEHEADLTWFGRAFLENGLALGLGFEAAFHHAEKLLHDWEQEQELEHSEPQIHVGSEIRKKLQEMNLL